MNIITKPLTHRAATVSMKSLTKTNSGNPRPTDNAVFLRLLKAQSRHLFGGSRGRNKTPTGNKSRRLLAVSETRHPYLNGVAKSKLKPTGDTMSKSQIYPIKPIAVTVGKPSLFMRLRLFVAGGEL